MFLFFAGSARVVEALFREFSMCFLEFIQMFAEGYFLLLPLVKGLLKAVMFIVFGLLRQIQVQRGVNFGLLKV